MCLICADLAGGGTLLAAAGTSPRPCADSTGGTARLLRFPVSAPSGRVVVLVACGRESRESSVSVQ